MSIQSINPATGQVLETFTAPTAADVERALASAHRAFGAWRDVPFATRTQHMQKAASILRGRKAEFARTMTLEMGKPIVQGEAEVEKCAWTCEYYAQHARPCWPSSRARRTPPGASCASIRWASCWP